MSLCLQISTWTMMKSTIVYVCYCALVFVRSATCLRRSTLILNRNFESAPLQASCSMMWKNAVKPSMFGHKKVMNPLGMNSSRNWSLWRPILPSLHLSWWQRPKRTNGLCISTSRCLKVKKMTTPWLTCKPSHHMWPFVRLARPHRSLLGLQSEAVL